ncbi:MAG: TerB family tellurite resistance protein [Pseudomonadota bacterium]
MTKYTHLVDRVRKAALTDARVNDFDDVQLAAAMLLVNAAKMDGHMSEPQRQAVLGNLRRKFSLQDEQAEELMDQAKTKNAQDASLYKVAETLEDGMSLRQRQELMGMVRDVVFSDGEIDPLEQALLGQMASMLNVPKDNPMAARARVAALLGIAREHSRQLDQQHLKEEQEHQQQLAAKQNMARQQPTWQPPGLSPFGNDGAVGV